LRVPAKLSVKECALADIDISYDPITVNGGPYTVNLTGLDNVKLDAKVSVPETVKTDSKLTLSVPDTVKTDSKFTLSVPEPVKTETRADIDLKPLALDQCLRISLAPLPATCIRFPNEQRIGLSLFGVEIFGVSLQGESQVVVCEPQKVPHIVAGAALAPSHAKTDGGLRIRLNR
jgi:hypothetical protein